LATDFSGFHKSANAPSASIVVGKTGVSGIME